MMPFPAFVTWEHMSLSSLQQVLIGNDGSTSINIKKVLGAFIQFIKLQWAGMKMNHFFLELYQLKSI